MDRELASIRGAEGAESPGGLTSVGGVAGRGTGVGGAHSGGGAVGSSAAAVGRLECARATVGVEFRALGAVEAVVGGCLVDLGPPKQRSLCALLLSRADRPVAVDTLVEELWSGTPPAAAATSLQVYVSNLRRVLEPNRAPRAPAAVLRTQAPGYVLDTRSGEFDVRRFLGHAMAGRQALDRPDLQQAVAEFDAALGLWRGEAYADVRDAPWVAPEVARLDELRLSVIEARLAALLELGAHAVAVGELDAYVQAHPLREHGCQLLALALYRAGRQAEALAVLRAMRARLAEELGIDPGTALQRLEQDILTHAPVLDWQPLLALSVPSARTTQAVSQEPVSVSPKQAGDDLFVGRQPALARLFDALGAVAGGHGRVVVVAGEPGIGKTGLLRRFAELAGAPVAWGGCPEHVAAPPLWPWEQVLRAVRTCCPTRPVPALVAELLDGYTPEISEVYDVAGAALRRFEAIGEYLAGGPGDSPLVVILDDLHWADIASLRLLAHLAHSVTVKRLLLVGSYRPHESGALAETLAALTRAGAERIELTGLTSEEAAGLVRAMAGGEVGARTSFVLWARTEGNPFFLRELVRLLASEQRLDEAGAIGGSVPAPVREVVLRRVARLPEAAAALVSVAAVAGRDFDIQVVAEAVVVEVEAALEALDAAVAAGLVVEDEHRLGWFRFSHALVVESVYEAIGRLRRVRQHRRIGVAAARAWAGRDERAAEIARHWLLAAELDSGTATQAAAYAAAAARAADARLAPEDAAELWQQALAAAELPENVDRYPLLIGLATSLYRAGHASNGLPVFAQAMEHALADAGPEATDHSRLVTAAVAAMGESIWYPVDIGVVDEPLVNVLQQALSRLTDPVHRALVLSCLAVARYYDDHPEGRLALTDEALALARSAADDVSLAQVLHLRALALNSPDYPEQCLQATTELLSLAHVSPSLVATARLTRADWLVTLGHISEAAVEFDAVATLVEQLRSRLYRAQLDWSRAGLLLLAGRWQHADELSRTTYDLQARMRWGVGIAQGVRIVQRWESAYLTGTGADLIDELRAAADVTSMPALSNILAMALVQAGRTHEARAVLRHATATRKDYLWLYTQCWGLLAAARLGETELVARVRDQLLPYRHLACVAGSSVAVSGSVAYFTAEAALALGEPDAALADLAIAIEMDQRMDALPWLAQARDAITRAQQLRQAGTKPPAHPDQVR